MNIKLSLTLILIIINVLVFLAETAAGGTRNTETAMKFGAMYTPDVRDGEWYRLLTAMFLHFGAIHLLCNLYALYNMGPSLERFLGIPVFLALYLVSGLAGNLLTFFMEERTNRYSVSAGASGAIFGLLGAYLVIALHPDYQGVSLQGILYVLLVNGAYGFSRRGINVMAHLGGLIGGAAFMAVVLMIR